MPMLPPNVQPPIWSLHPVFTSAHSFMPTHSFSCDLSGNCSSSMPFGVPVRSFASSRRRETRRINVRSSVRTTPVTDLESVKTAISEADSDT
ncbi:hypothetical protein Tcan_05142 [Toxocara canis]|uniref:Uncharacterized protein n=1 Tax=Toxocara canis TaxID=6265 RepID=A0A0B2UYL9_TOXCA|nr:hypothetical protein Tcan_05142 [Toxocara canis]